MYDLEQIYISMVDNNPDYVKGTCGLRTKTHRIKGHGRASRVERGKLGR